MNIQVPNENNWQQISSIMWLKYTIEMFGEKANIDAWFWKLAPRSSGVVLKRNQTSAVWKRVNEEKNIYFAEVCDVNERDEWQKGESSIRFVYAWNSTNL